MTFPSRIKLVEVGPRDGLQNEKAIIPTSIKIELIRRLSDAGLRHIEATSFVSKKWVPQMADATEVLSAIGSVPSPDVAYTVLAPNLKGLDLALDAGAKEVAIFTAASDSFCQKNINCSIDESFQRFHPVVERAHTNGMRVRGYVSCIVSCPYEGTIKPSQVHAVTDRLLDIGCYEVSLGDTIGVATPIDIKRLLEVLLRDINPRQLAGHYHDTYGMAISNIFASIEMGLSIFDTSIGGLGGCPYANGASGNIATEDVVWFMQKLGIDTGVDLSELIAICTWLQEDVGLNIRSHASQALRSDCAYTG